MKTAFSFVKNLYKAKYFAKKQKIFSQIKKPQATSWAS